VGGGGWLWGGGGGNDMLVKLGYRQPCDYGGWGRSQKWYTKHSTRLIEKWTVSLSLSLAMLNGRKKKKGIIFSPGRNKTSPGNQVGPQEKSPFQGSVKV